MSDGAAANMEGGYSNYGAFPEARKLVKRVEKTKPVGIAMLLGCVVVPWLIFVVTYYMISFNVRYWASIVAYVVVAITLLASLGFGAMAAGAAMGKGGDPVWLGLLCLLSLVGWIWAIAAGGENFTNNMAPYYELQQLNVYQSVDPSVAEGNQYMDFGIINFIPKAQIDRVFSMAFKNDDTYCVAPVKLNGTAPSSYDFWAVGTNCCSSHLYDFRCGQWNDPSARSGVRVVKESQRAFYQLAVKQSEAAFNIQALHPVFFEWVTDPREQVDGSSEAGFRNFLSSAFVFFGFSVAVVTLVACTLFHTSK